MAIGQAQSISELLSLGIRNSNTEKSNSVRAEQQQFGSTLKAFSSSYSGDSHPSAHTSSVSSSWQSSGKGAPIGGKSLPEDRGAREVASTHDRDVDQINPTQPPEDKEALVKDLEDAGVDPQKLKELVVSEGEMTEEEFDQLLESPEAFLQQLNAWLQTPGLGQEILALAEQPMALQQLALISRQNGRPGGGENTTSQPTQVDATAKKEPASDLVGRLLEEQGGGNLEEGLSKDKLFEQLLSSKNAESANKSGQFASLLQGENIQPGNKQSLGQAGISLSGMNVAGQSTTQGAQALPQLPTMRGLPGQPGATEALSERIMMMRAKNMQIAEIKLNPQELGALEVRIKVVNDVANVQFHSPNPSVREALEGQIVRLREMMDGTGLSLGDVGVSDQSLSERTDESFAEHAASTGVSPEADGDGIGHESMSIGAIAQSRQALGLVDYFA
jgi:flagellar hook-length control protein FliK